MTSVSACKTSKISKEKAEAKAKLADSIIIVSKTSAEQYHFKEIMDSLQYYVTDSIELFVEDPEKSDKESITTIVKDGKLLVNRSGQPDVVIPKNAPCVFKEKSADNGIIFKFGNGDSKALVFTLSSDSAQTYFPIGKSDRIQRHVKYDGKELFLSDRSLGVMVYLKKDELAEFKKTQVETGLLLKDKGKAASPPTTTPIITTTTPISTNTTPPPTTEPKKPEAPKTKGTFNLTQPLPKK